MRIYKHTSFLTYLRQEYCLIWAAGGVGGLRGDITGVGKPSDAFGNSSADFGASHYQSVFTQLVAVVQEKIIDGLDVCKMTDLRDTYIDLLDEIGIDVPNYRTEKLKARLQKHFGDRLSFWLPQQRVETEIVFSKTVSTGLAVEAVVTAVEMISSPGDDVSVRLAVKENEYNKAHQVFDVPRSFEESCWQFGTQWHSPRCLKIW